MGDGSEHALKWIFTAEKLVGQPLNNIYYINDHDRKSMIKFVREMSQKMLKTFIIYLNKYRFILKTQPENWETIDYINGEKTIKILLSSKRHSRKRDNIN